MRLLAIGLSAALMASLAHARGGGGKPPTDLVPYGADWSCFHAIDPTAAGGEPSRCERTEAECKATRTTLTTPSKMTACEPQPTATVVTYYDPKRASWRFLASPNDDGCLDLRAGLIATKAYERVTQCEIIGKHLPPPAKVHTDAITPGKGWWCLDLPTPAPKGVRAACVRTIGDCEDSIRRDSLGSTKCEQLPTAFVVTFKDSSSLWGYTASATRDECASYRERVVGAASDVSACAAISTVERSKLDRKRVPRGNNWECFVGADPTHPIGGCTRTAKDCAAQFELNRYVLGASPGCKTQSTAHGRNIQDQFFAFPNAALCAAHIAAHPDGSRCEVVN